MAEPLVAYMQFRDEFAGILDPRTHTIEWLDHQVRHGFMRVFGADDACMLAEIRMFPTGAHEVHAMIAAGNIETIIGVLRQQVEAWARETGALFVTASSRKGWERVLRPYGYEFWQSELRLEL